MKSIIKEGGLNGSKVKLTNFFPLTAPASSSSTDKYNDHYHRTPDKDFSLIPSDLSFMTLYKNKLE